jgi:cell division protein FtsA
VSRDEIVVGLDIGTTKVCTVVGHGDAQGRLTIDGVGIVPSRGMKKGVVIDVEDTVNAIQDSVERAQHMAGVQIKSVITGVTGDHVHSSNRKGSVTVAAANNVLAQTDIERVLQAAAMDVPRDREIIHSLPRDFTVDGHRGVRRPIGMCGERLEVETHIVTGTASFLNNIVQCVERAGLNASALVLEPIATSEAVATADERELGVALIDIGGGTSDIAVFSEGSIIYSAVIPVGGNHVTRDISIGLRTPFEIAERLKIERGVASPALIPHGEALEVMTAGSGERLRLPRAVLGEIIEARMIELFEMARDAIGVSRLQKRVPAGVILSGGGSLLPGAIELAQQVFDLPVRLGKPVDLDGWSDQVDSPQFATAVGLLRFALRQQAAQMGNGAMSALGVVGADPQRRIWSVPVPSPYRSTEEMAQHNIAFQNEAAQQAGESADAASHTGSTPDGNLPKDKRDETPFDRVTPEASQHDLEYSQSDERTSENGSPEEPLWQKWLAKLRQLIGFE